MGNWTVKKVPITADSEEVEEHEGRIQGQAGKVVGIECADDSGVKTCEPDAEDCKLQQWMESVKVFIRQIDVDAL